MPLNTTDDLETELQQVGKDFDVGYLDRKLRSANRKLSSTVGRQFVDKLVAEDDDQEDFDLAFDDIHTFDKIRDDGGEVDSSNYTTNLDDGTVSFTTSHAEDNIADHERLRAYYTPTIFKDLELAYAVKSVLRMTSIVTADEEKRARVEELDTDIAHMENMINSRTGQARLIDHQPAFGNRIEERE